MDNSSGPLTRLGRILFGTAMAGIGTVCLGFGQPAHGLEPLPTWVPAQAPLAYPTGVLLLGAGLGLIVGKGVRGAANVLGGLLLLWMVLLQWPKLVFNLHNGGVWTTAFETLALSGAAWIVAGRWTNLGRICYGISLPIFGMLHFVYAKFIATLIPAWIPGRLFLAVFIGVAFVAAGLSIVTRIQARLAAVLIGIMFATWLVILHAPRVAHSPHLQDEWTSMLIALAMSGGAFLVAGSVERAKP